MSKRLPVNLSQFTLPCLTSIQRKSWKQGMRIEKKRKIFQKIDQLIFVSFSSLSDDLFFHPIHFSFVRRKASASEWDDDDGGSKQRVMKKESFVNWWDFHVLVKMKGK